MTEQELIALYRRYDTPLHSFAMKHVDIEDARDLVSSAWVQVIIGKITDSGHFFSNMCSFVLWRIADRKKHNRRASRLTPEQVNVTQPVYPEQVWKSLELLPVGQRTVARMIFMEDYTPKECAEVLGISVDTVRVQVMKARRFLKVILS